MGCVIRYESTHGVVFRLVFRDADGRQVVHTLGRASDGRTEKKEEGALEAIETDVNCDGCREPERYLFISFADRFLHRYLPGRNLKPTGLRDYRVAIRNHLVPFFGQYTLVDLEQQPELIDLYIGIKSIEGLAPKTIHNHLTYLNVMLKKARAWRLIQVNPMADIERPRLEEPEMNILTESEIARLQAAYEEIERETPGHTQQMMWRTAKRLVFIALATGLRRGELLGLRWKNVNLLEGLILVREAWVEGKLTTPKSRAGRRTIELGPRAKQLVHDQWAATSYRGEEDFVFCHPDKGTPLDPGNLHRRYLRLALQRAGIDKPFRVFHDMRHTSLTHEAAAGNPLAYVQLKAGHSRSSITDRYIHAAQVLFPGAAARGENRIFRACTDPARRTPAVEPHQ